MQQLQHADASCGVLGSLAASTLMRGMENEYTMAMNGENGGDEMQEWESNDNNNNHPLQDYAALAESRMSDATRLLSRFDPCRMHAY